MTQLSKEAIEEFRAIYREEFGKELSDDEVDEMGMRVLRLFHLLEQPEKEPKDRKPEKLEVRFSFGQGDGSSAPR